LQAVFLAGGYREPEWLDGPAAAKFDGVPLLVVQDLFATKAAANAKFLLPSASFAEKDGTFVNHAGLAQVIRRAARSPQEARAEGQVFGDLLERRGLYRAEAVRAELAREVPFFAALGGAVSELGIRLG
jgi:NADH-quinone oxidoreductase subunit G